MQGVAPPIRLSRGASLEHPRLTAGAKVMLGGIAVGLACFALIVAKSSSTTVIGLPVLGMTCVWLASTRLQGLALALVMVYIGVFDGYLRLRTGSPSLTLVRDALFYALVVGALVRLSLKQHIEIPRWTPWIVAFVAIVVIQIANPSTPSLSIGIQGIRPHVEWIPLFFFGYALMRTVGHLRAFLLLLVTIGAINGIVDVIQYSLTPAQLSRWGPGYASIIQGTGRFTGAGRVFYDTAAGQHTRPFGLGSDTGFGGLVGLLAAPSALALMMIGRERWMRVVAVVGGVCIVAGIITSQQRTSVVGAVIAIAAFAVYASVSGRALRTSIALIVVGVIGYFVITAIVHDSQANNLSRYATISPGQLLSTTQTDRATSLASLPRYFTSAPFGVGLGRSGPAQGLNHTEQNAPPVFTGVSPNSETEPNYLLSELGVPGLIVYLLFSLMVVVVAFPVIRRVQDGETRIMLAAITAPLVAVLAVWISTSTSATTPVSPYVWFSAGIIGYWAAHTKRRRRT